MSGVLTAAGRPLLAPPAAAGASSPAAGAANALAGSAAPDGSAPVIADARAGEPLLMGIVNIGTDSVADDRSLLTLEAQLAFARRQHESGAAIIDIGVQSGRTDTPIISEQEEIERLAPLVGRLAADGVCVSVDTFRAGVAEAAVREGAAIINDVGGLCDPRMASVAAASGAALVLLETRAQPKARHFPGYAERPAAEVMDGLRRLIARARAAGVGEEQLILDPGLDYAKTPAESIEVLRGIGQLHRLGRPLLLAVSRKYFLGMITGRPPLERLGATLAAICFGVDAGAQIIRVHDVAQTADMLAVTRTLRSRGEPALAGDPHSDELRWLAPGRAATTGG